MNPVDGVEPPCEFKPDDVQPPASGGIGECRECPHQHNSENQRCNCESPLYPRHVTFRHQNCQYKNSLWPPSRMIATTAIVAVTAAHASEAFHCKAREPNASLTGSGLTPRAGSCFARICIVFGHIKAMNMSSPIHFAACRNSATLHHDSTPIPMPRNQPASGPE